MHGEILEATRLQLARREDVAPEDVPPALRRLDRHLEYLPECRVVGRGAVPSPVGPLRHGRAAAVVRARHTARPLDAESRRRRHRHLEGGPCLPEPGAARLARHQDDGRAARRRVQEDPPAHLRSQLRQRRHHRGPIGGRDPTGHAGGGPRWVGGDGDAPAARYRRRRNRAQVTLHARRLRHRHVGGHREDPSQATQHAERPHHHDHRRARTLRRARGALVRRDPSRDEHHRASRTRSEAEQR